MVTIYQTGIPIAGRDEAYEYALPVRSYPSHVCGELSEVMASMLHRDEAGLAELISSMIDTRFHRMRSKLLSYAPVSVLVFAGVPYVRMKRTGGETLCVPPVSAKPMDSDFLKTVLPIRDRNPSALMELEDFYRNFSGIYEAWPWNAEGLAVIPSGCLLQLKGAREVLGLVLGESRDDTEIAQAWLDGVQLIDEGEYYGWYVSSDGEVGHFADYRMTRCFASICEMEEELFQEPKWPFLCFYEARLSAYSHFPAYDS